MAIRYYTDSCNYRLPKKRLTSQWLTDLISSEGYLLGDINYIFCSSDRLLAMNREFLQHDYYTDVITFDYSDLIEEKEISGDIFIDVDTVRDNARQFGFRSIDEMRRVVVHGVLHLCGYKDKSIAEGKKMRLMEDKYLKYWQIDTL